MRLLEWRILPRNQEEAIFKQTPLHLPCTTLGLTDESTVSQPPNSPPQFNNNQNLVTTTTKTDKAKQTTDYLYDNPSLLPSRLDSPFEKEVVMEIEAFAGAYRVKNYIKEDKIYI